MFCKNCGNQIPDGVAFCNNCGAAAAEAPAQAPVAAAPVVEQAPAAQYVAPQYAAPAPQKSNGKMIGIIIAAVAAVAAIVVVLVLVLGGGSGSPEAVAEKYIIAQIEYDANGLVDCMADLTLKQSSEMLGYDEINKDAILEKLEESIPEDPEIKDYEIISVERSDEGIDFDEEIEGIKEQFGEEAANAISEICKVRIELKLDGETTSRTVTCIKENGDWKVAG